MPSPPKSAELIRTFPLREVTLSVSELRLGLPKEVAADLGWTLSDGEILVCRYMKKGLQRIYRQTPDVVSMIAEERAAADALEGDQRIERLLVIGDVFREITWQPKSPNRFKVDRELVIAFLGPDLDAKAPTTYMQAGPTWIEFFTHEIRSDRLQRWEQAMAARADA